MGAACGTDCRLSQTLEPDYWHLQNFDAKATDSDDLALAALVNGQADVREIYNNTLPRCCDDLHPVKVNFGAASYGRGYTLADPSCNQLQCPF
ncbi:hypothetical protein F5X97DRAFT_323168 [Nemania serpens]|nr:hypothetical protein F5X97DRAFT_323168 [Nemania serpens]